MKITSKLNKKAWKIRHHAAHKYNVKVMQVPWGVCIAKAKQAWYKRFTSSYINMRSIGIAIASIQAKVTVSKVEYDNANDKYWAWARKMECNMISMGMEV